MSWEETKNSGFHWSRSSVSTSKHSVAGQIQNTFKPSTPEIIQLYLSCDPWPSASPGSTSPRWRPCHCPYCQRSSFWISAPSPRWICLPDHKRHTSLCRSSLSLEFHFFLLPENTASQWGILYLTGSVQATESVQVFLFFFLPLLSLTFSASVFFFFFFSPALAKCLPAGYDVRNCQSLQSGLWREKEDSPAALPCYVLCVHPDPTHQTTPPRTLAEWAPKHTDLCTDYVITSKSICESLSLPCRSLHWCFVASDPNKQFKTIKRLFFSHDNRSLL